MDFFLRFFLALSDPDDALTNSLAGIRFGRVFFIFSMTSSSESVRTGLKFKLKETLITENQIKTSQFQ